MDNTKSEKKKTKVIKKKTAINRVRIGKYKGAITQMEELIKSGDKAKIDKFFSTFQSQLMKVSKKGSIKRKTASRKISRISKKISTIKK